MREFWFRIFYGFGRIVLPRFSKDFGWFSRLKKCWVFLRFLGSFLGRRNVDFPRVFFVVF